ncbi:SRPBCC family protein [Niabella yanshanensis]|uniref:SRPBCC family protein n=1 Tax=Niabella yanshanensis TaxID=577386 RepID=A0ABZ0W222_9BACT|nr:SRPBCC family protein [Niabella yanshanensis]WQD37267.1 SRPBCC family protein [Niabella yanshanensis]
MSILKKLLIALLALSAMALVTAAFVDGSIKVQQTIHINAPVENVWNFTSNITGLNCWNAWFKRDKMMRTSIAGNEGRPGSSFCWESDSTELGKGCLTISQLTTLRDVTLDITVYAPYKTHAKTYISLQPINNTTRVTLNFNSHVPYPLNIMMLFKRTKKTIATNYALSLQELKRLSEGQ